MGEVCPACKGLPFLRRDGLNPDDEGFGKLFPCPHASHDRERKKQLWERSGLKPHEWGYTFDSIAHINPQMPKMVAMLRRLLIEMRGWLYLHGNPGNGKTLALFALCNEFIARGRSAMYAPLPDLYGLARYSVSGARVYGDPSVGASARHPRLSYEALFKRLEEVQLLAIDEFDVSKINATPFAEEFRNRLINHRYRDAIGAHGVPGSGGEVPGSGGKVTVFAGNEHPAGLPGWIYDRLRDGRFTIWENTAPSVRPLMEW